MLQVVWSMVHVRSTLYGFTDMGYFFSSSFFACLWDRDGVEANKNSATLVNKGFIIRQKNTILMRETAGNPERARQRHLARSSSHLFILPAHGANNF